MLLRIMVLLLLIVPTFLISGISHPACFTENRGQWPEQVKFRAELSGSVIWVTDSAVVTDYYKIGADSIMHGHVIGMNYLGREDNVSYTPGKKISYFESYFNGRGITKAECFREIIQHNVYAGIDVRYYFKGNNFRYDFIVNPNANPLQISVGFSGQYKLTGNDNNIALSTRFGQISHTDLAAFDGNGKKISCSFARDAYNNVSFSVGDYDRSQRLIIDPMVSCGVLSCPWSEYIAFLHMCNDGNLIFKGQNLEPFFPLTDSVYDNQAEDFSNVVKTSFDMKNVLFSIRIQGDNIVASRLYIDNKDNIYIITRTSIDTMYVSENAYQKTVSVGKNHLSNFHIAKINEDVSQILAATYFGGNGNETIYDILFDKDNCPVMIVHNDSADIPVTQNAYAKEHIPFGRNKVMVVKLDEDLSTAIFSTYLSKNYCEDFRDALFNKNGDIVICGQTSINEFDITPNAYKKTHSTNFPIGYLGILSNDGSELKYGSCLDFHPCGLAMDSSGQIYIAGVAAIDGLGTEGTVQEQRQETDEDNNDMYICKFNDDLTKLDFGTYLGGERWEQFAEKDYKIVIDKQNRIYLAGYTYSSNFPVTEDAIKKYYASNTNEYDLIMDVTFSVFNNDASELIYSTYVGGALDEEITNLFINEDDVLLVGRTCSNDFITTDGTQAYGGNNDIFIFRYNNGIGIYENSFSNPELSIYPNPAKTTARLSLPGAPIDRIDIYDLEGRQAGNAGVQYDGASPVINVEGLPAGVYIVQVSSGKRLFSARLVVAHG